MREVVERAGAWRGRSCCCLCCARSGSEAVGLCLCRVLNGCESVGLSPCRFVGGVSGCRVCLSVRAGARARARVQSYLCVRAMRERLHVASRVTACAWIGRNGSVSENERASEWASVRVHCRRRASSYACRCAFPAIACSHNLARGRILYGRSNSTSVRALSLSRNGARYVLFVRGHVKTDLRERECRSRIVHQCRRVLQ